MPTPRNTKMLTTTIEEFKDNLDMKDRGFFSSFFKTREKYFLQSNTVKIDIVRNGHKVAPTLRDRGTGGVLVSAKDFMTREYEPPVIVLETPADLFNLMERRPGESEDASAIGSWKARLFSELKDDLISQHLMIREAVELQAAQILQTGKLELKDEKSNQSYVLEYPVKEGHFPTVTTSWGTNGATPMKDILALCNAINSHGKKRPTTMIVGENAWFGLLKDADFEKAIRKDGIGLGAVNPNMADNGAVYQGYLNVGSFMLKIYTYNASYEELGSEDEHFYLDPDKVIITADESALDFRLVFGGVPTLGMEEPFSSIIPSEVVYDSKIKVSNRVYKDEKANTFTAESSSRPLCIPVSIDRFGCITTKTA